MLINPDNEIVVIEDVLSESHLAMVTEAVKSNRFPWYFMENTHTYADQVGNSSYGFIHWLHEPDGFDAEPSIYLNIFSPVLYIMLDRVDLSFRRLIRARVNLSTRSPEQHGGYPHVDWTEQVPYFSGLFYLEDSDGDTCFYDYRCSGGMVSKNPEDAQIIKRVTPKRNRGVIFNGNIAHSAMLPLEHDTRTVVNFCFLATQH